MICNSHELDINDHKDSYVTLRVSNVRKQAKEIKTQAKNPGSSEAHTNACTNKISCTVEDMYIEISPVTWCNHLERYNKHALFHGCCANSDISFARWQYLAKTIHKAG